MLFLIQVKTTQSIMVSGTAWQYVMCNIHKLYFQDIIWIKDILRHFLLLILLLIVC